MSTTYHDSIKIEYKEGVLEALKELLATVDDTNNWFFHYDCDTQLIDLLIEKDNVTHLCEPRTINIHVETRYGLNTEAVDKLFKTTGAFGYLWHKESTYGGYIGAPSFTTVYSEGKPYQYYVIEYAVVEGHGIIDTKPIETTIVPLEERGKNTGRHWSFDIDVDLPF